MPIVMLCCLVKMLSFYLAPMFTYCKPAFNYFNMNMCTIIYTSFSAYLSADMTLRFLIHCHKLLLLM